MSSGFAGRSMVKLVCCTTLMVSTVMATEAMGAQAQCTVGYYNGRGPFLMLHADVFANEPKQHCSASCVVYFKDGSATPPIGLQGDAPSGASSLTVSWQGLTKEPASTSGNAACYPR